MKYRRLSGLGALPVNIDAVVAPSIGVVTSIGTAALLARYGSTSSWFTRHAGASGAGAGILAALLYGLARGTGAGIALAAVAAASGAAIEVFQYVVSKRLTSAMAPAAAAAGPAGMGRMGFIRAKMLKGLGEQMRRGYKMSGGTSLLEANVPGVVF